MGTETPMCFLFWRFPLGEMVKIIKSLNGKMYKMLNFISLLITNLEKILTFDTNLNT